MEEIVNVFKNLPDDPLYDLRDKKRLYGTVKPVVSGKVAGGERDGEIKL